MEPSYVELVYIPTDTYMIEQLNEVECLFLAFADKTRLRLLYLLRDGEVSVNALCEGLNTSQPKVSRHLAYLRTMNMVTTRREGKSIYYKLNLPSNPFGASLVEETIDWLDSLSGPSRGRLKPQRSKVAQTPLALPLFKYDSPDEGDLDRESGPDYIEREMEIYLL